MVETNQTSEKVYDNIKGTENRGWNVESVLNYIAKSNIKHLYCTFKNYLQTSATERVLR